MTNNKQEIIKAIKHLEKEFDFKEVRHSLPKPFDRRRFNGAVKALFSPYFEDSYINDNLDIPADYLEFLSQLQGTLEQGDWKFLHNEEWVLLRTRYFCKAFKEGFMDRKTAGTPCLSDVIWLCVGDWSNKHDYILCCDKSSEHYGIIYDVWDDHPWLSEHFLTYETYKTVMEFLQNCGTKSGT